MEQLLHYVWHHKLYPLRPLSTTDGQPVEVIDPGLPNNDAGPDFTGAKLKIGGTLWAGNVEVHDRSTDWARHGHSHDTAYDSVILHVVGHADCPVTRTDGTPVPQLELPCPEEVRTRYEELLHTDFLPPCFSVLGRLPHLTVHSWMSALLAERFERKAADLRARTERLDGRWDDAFFVTLARNFGFHTNADAFEAWAMRLPFRAMEKLRDNSLQVQALFFGTAGLLDDPCPQAGPYYEELQREYAYLRHKLNLPVVPPPMPWRKLRMRPASLPHVRLAQLGALYAQDTPLYTRLLEAGSPAEACTLLAATAPSYWDTHTCFGPETTRHPKRIGSNAMNLIVINTIVPFLYAYGTHKADRRLCQRAADFLDGLKAEDNSVIRQWRAAGIDVKSAADSQALLQLRTAYCDRKDCLRCRFGYEYLRNRTGHGSNTYHRGPKP